MFYGEQGEEESVAPPSSTQATETHASKVQVSALGLGKPSAIIDRGLGDGSVGEAMLCARLQIRRKQVVARVAVRVLGGCFFFGVSMKWMFVDCWTRRQSQLLS